MLELWRQQLTLLKERIRSGGRLIYHTHLLCGVIRNGYLASAEGRLYVHNSLTKRTCNPLRRVSSERIVSSERSVSVS